MPPSWKITPATQSADGAGTTQADVVVVWEVVVVLLIVVNVVVAEVVVVDEVGMLDVAAEVVVEVVVVLATEQGLLFPRTIPPENVPDVLSLEVP